MPYLKVETNLNFEGQDISGVCKKISEFTAGILGKPEQFMMVSLSPNITMTLSGNTDPTAFVQLKSIGLAKDKCPELSKKICEFFEQDFKIPSDRIYIEFKNIDGKMFGWKKGTF
ncbi:MAG: hypothetical protein HQK76_10510 [Desulfobacterales bacterium]|nr:hypothetical protein [Desulfobacterales bacterium]